MAHDRVFMSEELRAFEETPPTAEGNNRIVESIYMFKGVTDPTSYSTVKQSVSDYVLNAIDAYKRAYRNGVNFQQKRSELVSAIKKLMKTDPGFIRMKQDARDLIAAEQTILRGPAQQGTIAPPGSAVDKAMSSGILTSQVGKFLTKKPIGESVKPAIRELKRDITGKGRRKKTRKTRRKTRRHY